MVSLFALTFFNVLVLLSPPKALQELLTLKNIPKDGRLVLLLVAVLNVVTALSFEKWGTQVVGWVLERSKKRRRRETTYKALDVE